MSQHSAPQISDASARGCLTRLLGQTAVRPDLQRFTGQLWLTYPQGRRLHASPFSGDLDPGTIRGQTFPDVLAMLALILTTPHGHVLCHSLVRPGISGVAAVGYTVFVNPDAHNLLKPQPLLIGLMVQLDGREWVLTHDPATGLAQALHEETGLDTVAASTWAIAEAIDNMSRAPLGPDAAALAREIVDIQPALVLKSGAAVKMSGSDIPGSASHRAASAFVARAAAQAAKERPPPSPRTATLSVLGDAVAVANSFAQPTVDTSQVVSRRFRNVE